MRTFQATLDDIGIRLRPDEIQVIQLLYGYVDDERINYGEFCQAMGCSITPNNSTNNQSNHRTSSNNGIESYINSRTIQRLKELKLDRRDPRDMFGSFDLENSGLIDIRKFRDINQSLQLLQSEYQLQRVLGDFASISNKNVVSYEDFCNELDRVANLSSIKGRDDDKKIEYKSKSFNVYGNNDIHSNSKYEDNSDHDVNLSPRNVDRWLSREASPLLRKEFTNVS
jgi:Ca2+-binding EF-hand superfamily protein